MAGRLNELDFETVSAVGLDNGTQIASPEAVFWQVPGEDYSIEEFELHRYLGCTVTSLTVGCPGSSIQTVRT